MRMQQFRVYSVKELDEKIREKVIQRYSDVDLFDEWWEWSADSMLEELANKYGILAEIKGFDLDRKEIEIKVTGLDENMFLSAVFPCQVFMFTKEQLEELRVYHHSKDWVIEADDDLFTHEQVKKMYDFLSDWTKKVFDVLKEDHEYRQSEECIIGFLEANGFEFFNDGTNVPRM